MKTRIVAFCLMLAAILSTTEMVRADAMSYPNSSFEPPKETIAFLGCLYSYQDILQKDTDKPFKALIDMNKEKDAATAETEASDAILETAKTYTMPLETIALPGNYKQWVLDQVEKQQIDPAFLAKLCGSKPYALIATVDRYGTFPYEVQMRSEVDGKAISYFGTPGVLEFEKSSHTRYQNTYKKVVAMSFYLFSAKDGKLVWQANGVAFTEKSFSTDIKPAARKCAEFLIKRFFKLG